MTLAGAAQIRARAICSAASAVGDPVRVGALVDPEQRVAERREAFLGGATGSSARSTLNTALDVSLSRRLRLPATGPGGAPRAAAGLIGRPSRRPIDEGHCTLTIDAEQSMGPVRGVLMKPALKKILYKLNFAPFIGEAEQRANVTASCLTQTARVPVPMQTSREPSRLVCERQ